MIGKDYHQARTEIRPLPIRYTVDDLEFLPDDETKRYELIGGRLFVSLAPHLNHQRTITNLLVEFATFLRTNPIGELFTTPGLFSVRKMP